MNSRKVYFDNSSTSVPKTPGVLEAVINYLSTGAYNVGRGGYVDSYDIALQILKARENIATLFNAADPREVIFTPSLTHSLNMILQGFLKEDDHVITTSMEHNSVMRPLYALAATRGVRFDVATCDDNGVLDPSDVAALIDHNTRAVVMTHASNVCGTVMPVAQIAELCKQRGIRLIVDAAQTAGVLPIDVSDIDALAFPGHKALLGPTGIGGFVIKSDFADLISASIWGGTGSQSQDFAQPDFLPDKFESGTQNIAGILGLGAAVEYVQSRGIEDIYRHEMKLYKQFIVGAAGIEGMRLIAVSDKRSEVPNDTLNCEHAGSFDCAQEYGGGNTRLPGNNMQLSGRIPQKVAVASVDFPGWDNAKVAAVLDKQYGIMARCGLHCAPAAHKTLGTYPAGTLRFSFGHANTVEEVDYLLHALQEIVQQKR